MSSSWTIGAQLSTTHSAEHELSVDPMVAAVEAARAATPIDIIVLGSKEMPEIFHDLTGPRRPADEVFLWFDLLSDFPGMADEDLVINWRGEKSSGWGGWAEAGSTITETFRFACPNNPRVRAKTLGHLRELLLHYPFDGVFIDKMRFPSPANGLEEVASCFCDHCRAAAAAVGLDLDAVVRIIDAKFAAALVSPARPNAADWLRSLLVPGSALAQFVDFRLRSVTSLVAEAAASARQLGRKVSLDLFSPSLASLVGQDYVALAQLCDWMKPMTYRLAQGPAGLRLEVPSLVEGAMRLSGKTEGELTAWAAAHMRGFAEQTLAETRQTAVPLDVMAVEVADAVRLAGPVPVYFGLELVRQEGVIDITPELVRQMVDIGRRSGVSGTIISWDLLHAPRENLTALSEALR